MAQRLQSITGPVEGTFEGKPTLSIPLASGKPFTFGVEKAAAIVKHVEAVKAFNLKYPAKTQKIDKETIARMSPEERAEIMNFLMANAA